MATPYDDDLQRLTKFEADMQRYIADVDDLVRGLRKSAGSTTFTGPAARRFSGDLDADLARCRSAVDALRAVEGSVIYNRSILEEKRRAWLAAQAAKREDQK